MTRRKTLAMAAAFAVTAAAVGHFSQGPNGTSGWFATAAYAADEDLMVAGPLGEKALGDPDAPNVVVEYASMTCPHCQHFHEATFDAFKEKYIDTGEVYFVFRHFPLNPLDTAAIMLTNCVPEDKFFPLVDLLFENQRTWAGADKPGQALLEQSKQAGFTPETFTACLQDQEVLDGIEDVRNRGADLGVSSTPTFFINGEKTAGALSLDQLDDLLAN